MRTTLAALVVISALGAPDITSAQGYRARLDVRSQSVRYRGWQIDSVLATDAVGSPSGGPATPDGFAVTCVSGDPYCFYYHAGPVRHAVPFSTTATATMWGLGVTGLSAHGSVRLLADFTGNQFWPGTKPAVQLIELYADYRRNWFGARAGREKQNTYEVRMFVTDLKTGEVVWEGFSDPVAKKFKKGRMGL